MDKLPALLFREIPVYKVCLAWLALLLLLVIVGSILNPSPDRKVSAKSYKIRSDEKFLVFMLKNQFVDIGLLASNEFVLCSIPPEYDLRFLTNQAGALIDVWQTPYKIEFLEQTNFGVHSAGKDKIFGTKDDIIFNSFSNDFVKP
jgi:hypothetical protein